jgi:hypothetical protein
MPRAHSGRTAQARPRADVDLLRQRFEAGQREAIQRLADRRLHLRVLGLVFVLIRLVLSLLGKLV